MSVSAKFITIEGGEGCGKSTLRAGLANWLTQKGLTSKVTREPGGTPMADAIRHIFAEPPAQEKMHIMTELMLVSAGRHQHVKELIKPTLAQNTWVICDRYVDSSRVYQGKIGGIESQFVEEVIRHSTEALAPDLTFLLDCPVEVMMQRLKSRDGQVVGVSRYDEANESFHRKIRDSYLELAKTFQDRIVLIDASQTPEKCMQQATQILAQRFRLWQRLG